MIAYDPNKIINQNSRHEKYYSDCQVVAAVNAHYLLTGEAIEQGSSQYNDLCELARACYGSAICIERVWDELGLVVEEIHNQIQPPKVLDSPLEYGVWHKRHGFHSVLIYDYEHRCQACRVAGLRWDTTTDHWIFWEDLHQLHARAGSNNKWTFRRFSLKESRPVRPTAS